MDGKKKIIVVDDEYSFCKSLRNYLEKQGYEVLLTTKGEQALEMVKLEKPDLMTLDILMPGINGHEVLEQAQQIDENLPIIIVSAVDIPDMEGSLKRAGAKAIFRKPANMNDLAKAIENLV